jgi:hypothetical protein
MGGAVVESDAGFGLQFRYQHLADLGGERLPVDCAFDHPGRDQPVLRQPRHRRLRAPLAERDGPGRPGVAKRTPLHPGLHGVRLPV